MVFKYIIILVNDASIKSKDIKTNDHGEYLTTDNISIISAACLSNSLILGKDSGYPLYVFFIINYNKKFGKIIKFYYASSYVEHISLNNYINNRNDNIKIYAYPNSIDYSIDIRLYYI